MGQVVALPKSTPETVDGDKHARLGCSNNRWRFCPGSVREEAAYPDIPSAKAQDGTGSHLLLELCLLEGVDARQYEGHTIGVGDPDSPNKMGWYVEIDRANRVQVAIDYVNDRVRQLKQRFPDCHILVAAESRSNPGRAFNRHDWWGTCDITIGAYGGHKTPYVEVVDYKDGSYYVSERKNSQLRDYLYGKVYHYNEPSQELLTTIIQPKTKNPIRSETVSRSELEQHGQENFEAAKRTDDPNAPLIPGKHCKPFCKHLQNCEAVKQQRVQKGAVVSNDIVQKVEYELSTMSGQELASIIDAKDVMLAAFSKAEAEAEERIKAGQTVPGYVRDSVSSKKVWALDEEEVEKKLRNMKLKKDQIKPPKMVSPSQALKIDGLTDRQIKRIEEELITTVMGEPKLKKGTHVEEPKRDVADFFNGVSPDNSAGDTSAPKPISFM